MIFGGIDLGGTNVKVALIDETGNVLCEASRPTQLPRPAEDVCDIIAATFEDVLNKSGKKKEDVAGLGIGCPGTVDDITGMVYYSNNLAWHDIPLREYLLKRTGFSVRIGNDANVAALGEAIAGCGKDAESLIVFTLGTGVGSGVVLDGKMLTGYTGAAAELGHMVIDVDGEQCTCGRRGCFESYASATALIRMTKEAMEHHPESTMHQLAEQEGTVSGKTAFFAAQAGDSAAQEVVNEYINWLAVGIANSINIFFPEVVGISGGISKQGDNLLVPLREAVEPMIFGHDFVKKHTRIEICTLGYRSGVVGAAMLARNYMNEIVDKQLCK
jgi:glucokinase